MTGLILTMGHCIRSSYIYVPLGGAKNVVLATLLVFTFVALWHDLSFRLLTWGWLVSLFILPELLANKMVPESKVSSGSPIPHFMHKLILAKS
jgi:D-alanyl-lipoteichoic acid acyltransferase DltB (MBOAT superfamily)